MFDEDAPETPDISRRDNAARPRRKKSARAQRHAARKKGRGGAKAPASLLAADSASAASSVPDVVATPPTSQPNDALFEPVGVAPSTRSEAVTAPAAASDSLQDQALKALPADAAGRPPEAPAIETPEDPEALALALFQEGRAQEAVDLLEREIALERVRAGVRVLAPAEASGLADQSAAQDEAIVESAPNAPTAADEAVPQPEATSGGTVIALPAAAALAAGQAARARRLPPLVDLVPGPRTAAAATASRRLSPVALLGGAAVACLLATGFLWAESDQAAESGAARPATRSVWPMIASVDGGAGQPNVLLPESLANLSENAAAKRPTGGEEAPEPSAAAANRDEQPLLPVAPSDERPAQARSAEAPASAAEAPLTRSIVQPLAPADASPQTPVDAAGSQLPAAGGTSSSALSAAEPPASVAPNREPPAEILAGTEAPFDGDDSYAGLSSEVVAGEDVTNPTIVADVRIPRPRPEPSARATRTTRAAAPVARSAPAERARAPAAQARAPVAPADPYVAPVDPYYAPALAQRRALAERYMAARRAAAQRRAFWNSRIIVLRGRPYQ